MLVLRGLFGRSLKITSETFLRHKIASNDS